MSHSGSYIQPAVGNSSKKKGIAKFRNTADRFEYEQEIGGEGGGFLNEEDRKFFPDVMKSLEVKSQGLFSGNAHFYEGGGADHWAIRKGP